MGRRSRTRGHRPAGRRAGRVGAGAEVELAEARSAVDAGVEVGRPVRARRVEQDHQLRLEAGIVGEVEHVAWRLVGECQGRDPLVSAIQIGKFVMTGPADASSGWPTCAMAVARAL